MQNLKTKVRSLVGLPPKRRRRIIDDEPKAKRQIIPDGKDVCLFGGLATAGYGLWQIYPPAAMILVGGIFFAIGIYWYLK